MHCGVGLVVQQDSLLETGECKIVYWRQGNARYFIGDKGIGDKGMQDSY